jgi:hypothetical protein
MLESKKQIVAVNSLDEMELLEEDGYGYRLVYTCNIGDASPINNVSNMLLSKIRKGIAAFAADRVLVNEITIDVGNYIQSSEKAVRKYDRFKEYVLPAYIAEVYGLYESGNIKVNYYGLQNPTVVLRWTTGPNVYSSYNAWAIVQENGIIIYDDETSSLPEAKIFMDEMSKDI